MRKHAVRTFLLAAALAVAVVAVRALVAQGQFPQPQPPQGLVGGFGETLSPEGKSLILALNTVEEYPCVNYRIDGFLNKDLDRKRVSLGPLVVIRPFICLPAFGPAPGEWDFGSLPEGTYTFEVLWANGLGRYKLVQGHSDH